jgi:hypothetical protein
MDKKKQQQQDGEPSTDYRFSNLYCHPDFLSGNGDSTVEQVFGGVSRIDETKDGGSAKPASMHLGKRRRRS